jgi:hypothetical protein
VAGEDDVVRGGAKAVDWAVRRRRRSAVKPSGVMLEQFMALVKPNCEL